MHDGTLLLLTVYLSGVVIATSGRKTAAGCDVASYLLDPQLCLLPHS